MLHKSSSYCPRQMSSSSLIFSMGAISMKVNPAFVFILIIASSLAVHLSTYIQSSHRLWGWAPFMALTPSPEVSLPVIMRRSELRLISWSSHLLLRCLRLSSWDGLILDLYFIEKYFNFIEKYFNFMRKRKIFLFETTHDIIP